MLWKENKEKRKEIIRFLLYLTWFPFDSILLFAYFAHIRVWLHLDMLSDRKSDHWRWIIMWRVSKSLIICGYCLNAINRQWNNINWFRTVVWKDRKRKTVSKLSKNVEWYIIFYANICFPSTKLRQISNMALFL